MHWRRVDAIQPASALFAQGNEIVEAAKVRLASKSALFRSLKQAEGDGWFVLFAGCIRAEDGASETILPSIPDMQALYEDAPGWWLPVGMAMATPEPLRPELRVALCAAHSIKPPLLLIPRFADDAPTTRMVDIFVLA